MGCCAVIFENSRCNGLQYPERCVIPFWLSGLYNDFLNLDSGNTEKTFKKSWKNPSFKINGCLTYDYKFPPYRMKLVWIIVNSSIEECQNCIVFIWRKPLPTSTTSASRLQVKLLADCHGTFTWRQVWVEQVLQTVDLYNTKQQSRRKRKLYLSETSSAQVIKCEQP